KTLYTLPTSVTWNDTGTADPSGRLSRKWRSECSESSDLSWESFIGKSKRAFWIACGRQVSSGRGSSFPPSASTSLPPSWRPRPPYLHLRIQRVSPHREGV